MIERLRKKIQGEEFDYQALLDVLKDYSCPRDKITDLLRQKKIIRIKKGLYIFGEDYAVRAFSREVLANLIYGPSYISLEYALSYYGIIPERVEAVTSVTTGRAKQFATNIGLFKYRTIPLNAYHIGVDRVEIDAGRAFLIASPEKALADKIYDDRGTGIRTQKEMGKYLLEQLRIDESLLNKMDCNLLLQIAKAYRSRKIQLLQNIVSRKK